MAWSLSNPVCSVTIVVTSSKASTHAISPRKLVKPSLFKIMSRALAMVLYVGCIFRTHLILNQN